MAWTAPRTWVAGETATAANFNAHIRDNLNWLANDRPRARVTKSSQSITPSTDVAILFPTEAFDVGAMHDGAVNTSRLTVPAGGGGVYLTGANYRMDASTTGRRITILRLNGTTDIAVNVFDPPSSGAYGDVITALYPLVAGDYLELFVNQNTGGSLNATDVAFWAIWQAF